MEAYPNEKSLIIEAVSLYEHDIAHLLVCVCACVCVHVCRCVCKSAYLLYIRLFNLFKTFTYMLLNKNQNLYHPLSLAKSHFRTKTVPKRRKAFYKCDPQNGPFYTSTDQLKQAIRVLSRIDSRYLEYFYLKISHIREYNLDTIPNF